MIMNVRGNRAKLRSESAGCVLQPSTARPSFDGHAVFPVIGVEVVAIRFPIFAIGNLERILPLNFSSYTLLIPYLEITICDLKF
jgi:hypothetical protein